LRRLLNSSHAVTNGRAIEIRVKQSLKEKFTSLLILSSGTVELHHEGDRVQHDEEEDEVLEPL
jgi:hypothetical protein